MDSVLPEPDSPIATTTTSEQLNKQQQQQTEIDIVSNKPQQISRQFKLFFLLPFFPTMEYIEPLAFYYNNFN